MINIKQHFHIFTFLLLFLAFQATAQVAHPSLVDVIPPSPEAESLGRYGSTPISYNTGTPAISIPLYEIKGKKIDLPISLSYDSKGFKVRQVAGWAGLGWTLHAGGAITRVVRGKPDEDPDGYFNRIQRWEELQDPQYDYTVSNYATNERYGYSSNAAYGDYDLIPDAFHFNFDGYSGTITFKHKGNSQFIPIISPSQDLKIRHGLFDLNNEWVITTPDGTEYTFGGFLGTEFTGVPYSTDIFPNAWYLSKIESADKSENIRFSYTSNDAGYYRNFDYNQLQTKVVNSTTYNANIFNDNCVATGVLNSFPQGFIYSSTVYLTTIAYNPPNGNSLFVDLSSTPGNRCDYQYGFTPQLRKLHTIHVSDDNSTSIERYTFSYGQFGDADECNSSNRLRLESLTEEGKPAYQFEYNDMDLPEYSGMIDHYGYPNGARVPNNNIFIPSLPTEYINQYEDYVGADREPSSATLAGLLVKMTYPTGGWTEFDFETHSSTQVERFISTLSTANATAYADESRHGDMNIKEGTYSLMWEEDDLRLVGGLPNVRVVTFTCDRQTVVPTASIFPEGEYAAPTGAYLYREDPESIHDWEWLIEPETELGITIEGTYDLVVGVAEDLPDDVQFNVRIPHVRTEEENIRITHDVFAGGARIREIRDYDGVSETPVTRNFYYYKDAVDYFKDPSSDWTTSETVFFEPDYFNTDYCRYKLWVASYTSDPFGRMSGHHIGYGEVAVTVDGIENGLTVYKYNNTSNPINRSILKSIEHYNGDLNLSQKVTHSYQSEYSQASSGYNIKIISEEAVASLNGGTQYMAIFTDEVSSNYNYSAYWLSLGSKSELFIDKYMNEHVLTENYTYHTDHYNPFEDEGKYQLLKEKELIIDENRKIVETFTYPVDYATSGVSVEQDMVLQNNYDHLLGYKKTYVNGDITQTLQENKYDYEDVNPDVEVYEFRPIIEYQRDLKTKSAALELKSTRSYDDLGNVLKLEDHFSGVNKTYLWDEQGQNLIAEVVNANENEVDFCGFEQDGYNPSKWVIDDQEIVQDEDVSFSGYNLYDLSNGSITYVSNLPSNSYVISLHAKDGNVTMNGSTQQAGDTWQLLKWDVDGGDLSISGSAFIDELRIYPSDRPIEFNTYYFQDNVGLISITDTNGQTFTYDYDIQNRLIRVSDGLNHVLTEYRYNYENNVITIEGID